MVTSLQEYCYFHITKNKYVSLFSLKGQFYLLIYTLNVWKTSPETVIYKIFAKLSLNTRPCVKVFFHVCTNNAENHQ